MVEDVRLSRKTKQVREIFKRLLDFYGPQSWWPGESVLEIMVGAVLTQNTQWSNVERALENLRVRGLFSLERLLSVPESELAMLLRPSGYFNLKTKRLLGLLRWIQQEFKGDFVSMRAVPLGQMRQALLSLKGIGPETADAILLYALNFPIFVIDLYTHRVLSRHFLVPEESCYDDLQDFMLTHSEPSIQTYNEFHALLVRVGKEHCGPKPICDGCPLHGINW